MPVEPWSVSPKLTAERLGTLAREPVRVRAEAIPDHRPDLGDDGWSFGCRVYRRTCFAFKQLEASGKYPWLRVEEKGLACRILVEGELLRFYCGEAQRPTSRSLTRGVLDLVRQGKLPYYDEELSGDASDEWFWLLAIEPSPDMSVLRVVILQANPRGDVRYDWEIPTGESFAAVGLVAANLPEAVELPPPFIGSETPVGLPAVADDEFDPAATINADDVDRA